jgi:hypothetical protein
MIRLCDEQRQDSCAVAGSCVDPLNLKSRVQEILDVRLELVLRLNELVTCAWKILRGFTSSVSVIGADVQNVFWIKSKFLKQREEIA